MCSLLVLKAYFNLDFHAVEIRMFFNCTLTVFKAMLGTNVASCNMPWMGIHPALGIVHVVQYWIPAQSQIIGGGTGGGDRGPVAVAPPLFRLGGMAPPLFLTILFWSKRHLSGHSVKCLTWWKKMYQIVSFIKDYIFKKAPTSEGAHPPFRHPPASCKRDGRRIIWSPFLTSKNWPLHFENRSATYYVSDASQILTLTQCTYVYC